ncbi:hypothetical protein [Streptomyces lydicus]|uniref:hypothetical protein n=1 Tax=Streptomyces lydicus TaxID=47763 RepID=UPI0036EFE9CE
MAGITTPAPRLSNLGPALRRWQGRALLTWARLLQRTVAGKAHREAHVARRNRAIRAAHARGVDKTTLAQALRVSSATIGQALKEEPTGE